MVIVYNTKCVILFFILLYDHTFLSLPISLFESTSPPALILLTAAAAGRGKMLASRSRQTIRMRWSPCLVGLGSWRRRVQFLAYLPR